MLGLPTDLEMIILRLLLARPGSELYGLQMVRADPDNLGKTSIYVLLTRMIARGFLESRYETDKERQKQAGRGPKRRLYKISAYGEQQYKAREAAERTMVRLNQPKPQGAL